MLVTRSGGALALRGSQPPALATGASAAGSPSGLPWILARQQLGSRLGLVVCPAAKGFGKVERRDEDDDDAGLMPGKKRARAKNFKRQMSATVPTQEQKDSMSNQFAAVAQLSKQAEVAEEDEDFSKRLLALKQQGEEMKKELKATGSLPVAPGQLADPSLSVFDQKPDDLYSNPPSITDTLMNQLNSDVSDPKLKSAQFGPNQVGVAAGAIIFGLVFVLVAGGDLAPNNRFKGVRPAREPPDAVEEGIIKGRIAQLENQLQATPGDTQATEALALSYARLLKFDKAASLLDKLTQRDPTNADAWRLLGETTLLAEQSQRSVKAYEQAVKLRDNDLQISTGLVDAYIANGQQSKAVDYLTALRARAPAVSALGVRAADAPADAASSSEEGAAAAPAEEASSSNRGGAPIRPLEPVSVELLLAKTYSAWRGHDNDALATYDALIARFPEDFRGYLAKGVYLRDKGRRADAERMFLQARFYAPENRQKFIQQTAADRPIIELPDND